MSVLNKFKNKNPIEKQTVVARRAFSYGHALTWMKPISNEDYMKMIEDGLNVLVSGLNWKRRAQTLSSARTALCPGYCFQPTNRPSSTLFPIPAHIR